MDKLPGRRLAAQWLQRKQKLHLRAAVYVCLMSAADNIRPSQAAAIKSILKVSKLKVSKSAIKKNLYDVYEQPAHTKTSGSLKRDVVDTPSPFDKPDNTPYLSSITPDDSAVPFYQMTYWPSYPSDYLPVDPPIDSPAYPLHFNKSAKNTTNRQAAPYPNAYDIKAPAPDTSAAPSATLIDERINMYEVTPLLLRSKQLLADDMARLYELNIDAVINLRLIDPHQNDRLLRDYHDANHAKNRPSIKLYNVPLRSWYITADEIARVLCLIARLHRQGRRVLVHCYHGANRTGLIIAMYRIIYQHWPIESARAEMINGGFGFSPFWVNIEQMIDKNTVSQVMLHLAMMTDNASVAG